MLKIRHAMFFVVGLIYLPALIWIGGDWPFERGYRGQMLFVFAPLLAIVATAASVATSQKDDQS